MAVRTRNFATVVYPDSAPADWQVILAEQCIPCFISPLHDADINPTGEPKKPHYHILFMYDGVKTLEQAQEPIKLIGGVGCEIVKSTRAYARYLCHLDNPEKFKYNIDDVVSIAADYNGVIGLAIDKYVAIMEMMDFIETYNIVSFRTLSRYAQQKRMDWFRVLCDSSAIYLKEYLQSRHWAIANGIDELKDLDIDNI